MNEVFAAQIDLAITQPPTMVMGNISQIISGAISLVLVIAVLAAFGFLIWGGLQWIMSGGDKTATEAARNRIQAAILGLFIVFASWAIMKLIAQLMGFNFPNFSFTTFY